MRLAPLIATLLLAAANSTAAQLPPVDPSSKPPREVALIGESQPLPPPTPSHAVADAFHGVSVADPYRWLEDPHDPAVRQWIGAQNAYTEAALAAMPQGKALTARVQQLAITSTTRSGPMLAGGTLFYLQQTPPQPQPVLIAQAWPDGAAKVLLDPNADHGGTAITAYWPSPRGRYLAYGTAEGGSELTTIRVLDVRTGETLPDTLPWAGGGTTPQGLAWDADERGFSYVRFAPPAAGQAVEQFHATLVHHALGQAATADSVVFGKGYCENRRVRAGECAGHGAGRGARLRRRRRPGRSVPAARRQLPARARPQRERAHGRLGVWTSIRRLVPGGAARQDRGHRRRRQGRAGAGRARGRDPADRPARRRLPGGAQLGPGLVGRAVRRQRELRAQTAAARTRHRHRRDRLRIRPGQGADQLQRLDHARALGGIRRPQRHAENRVRGEAGRRLFEGGRAAHRRHLERRHEDSGDRAVVAGRHPERCAAHHPVQLRRLRHSDQARLHRRQPGLAGARRRARLRQHPRRQRERPAVARARTEAATSRTCSTTSTLPRWR